MNASVHKSAKPVAATARIGYVFRNKDDKEFTDPQKAYEGLALAQCGHYPLGANGSFHGGIHFAAGTKAVFTQDKGVRCIADGEVVAYRIDRRYPDATPADSTEPRPKDGCALRPYSSAFVLVRHRLQPSLPAFPDRPKESAISNFGTSLCNEAGRPLAWLPQGATLRLTGRTNRDRTWAQVDELTTPDQAVWSVEQPSDIWVRISDLMGVSSTRTGLSRLFEQNEYRINPAADRPDPRQVRANCDARLQQEEHRRQCEAMASAPTLTWYSLYMHLGDLASYEANPKRSRPAWWSGDKASQRLPHKLDKVMVLDQPVPIRQGQVVGFLGEDVPSDAWLPSAQPISRELLHLEAFSGDDVPGFIAACRQWAQQLPEDKRTQLGLKSGDELRGEPRSDAPVIATVGAAQTFPLSALKQAKDVAGHMWRQVSARTTGSGTAIGWIEEAGRRVSPWEWRDFQIIDEASNPAGTWWDDVQQFADYLRGSGIRPKETPLFAKIRSWLDANGDGRLDERELDMALKDRQLSSLIGGLIVRHRSAWDVPDWKERFGAIDDLIEKLGNHEDSVRYRAAEKERVRKLDWWSYVAGQVPGFPSDSNVYHFHPVALAGALSSTGSRCDITVELLEKVLGKNGTWFTGKGGGKNFELRFKESYPDVYGFDKHEFVNLLNLALERYEITSCYQKAHFVSQCFHECAHFETTIEFGSGKNYEPGVHPDAMANGNTDTGDGPRYRGRGLIQLTWKNNYQKYSNFRDVDFVSDPELIASDMYNSIDVSCWYWRKNGSVHKKHAAAGDINKLINAERDNVSLVTLAVNGGGNGLAERQKIFDAVKLEWGLE